MQLPPLQTIRAFEAAARLGSFARAADELALTASAVSHHMKGLESRLHAKLFVRAGRGVKLTEVVSDVGEGKRLREPIDPPLARRIEVPEVAVDVTVVQRRHRRPDGVHRCAVCHNVYTPKR